jgi:predicted dehydrogenase
VTPLRIGLVGAARITPQALIAPAAARADVEIVAVAARDPVRAATFAERHSIPEVEPDYRSLMRRRDIDLVYVATPPALHAEHAIEALRHHKAVLCEKPLAASLADTEAMVEESRRAGRPLIEAFHYRFHEAFARVLSHVQAGDLGRLEAIEARFDTRIAPMAGELRWSHALGGGALLDLGCYAVHAARTIAACEPEVVEARCDLREGVDASTSATLRFPTGALAQIRCSMVADDRDRSLTVRGSAGVLHISNYVNPQAGCSISVESEAVRTAYEPSGPTTFEAQLDHVVEVLAGRAAPLTGGQDAIENARTLAAISALCGEAARPK